MKADLLWEKDGGGAQINDPEKLPHHD